VTFTTSAKLPGCDVSDWTAASIIHNWGDVNSYQKLDVLENNWEIVGSSSGSPAFTLKLSDFVDTHGDRSQTGSLEWLNDYDQEEVGFNSVGTYYSVSPVAPISSTKCKSFTFSVPTSRGVLTGKISVTPYIGTGCPITSTPNPYVGDLTGTLTLTPISGNPTSYTIVGVAVEFMCSTTKLPTCSVPLPSSTALSCVPASVTESEETTCTATVTDASGSTSPITPEGTVSFATNSTGIYSEASCTLVQSGTSASCSVTYSSSSPGDNLLTATYQDSEEGIHSGSSGSFNLAVA